MFKFNNYKYILGTLFSFCILNAYAIENTDVKPNGTVKEEVVKIIPKQELNLDNNEEIQELLKKEKEYKPQYDITVEQYLSTLKMNDENKKYYLNLSKYYTQMVENYNKENVLMTLREPIFMNTTCAILQSGASSYEFMMVVLNLTLDKIGPDAIEKYKQANEYIEKNEPNVNPSFAKNCSLL